MAINVKNLKNTISLKGVVAGYQIEAKQGQMYWDDERAGLKKGDAVIQYSGYVTVQTAKNQFATINVKKNQSFRNGELEYGEIELIEGNTIKIVKENVLGNKDRFSVCAFCLKLIHNTEHIV